MNGIDLIRTKGVCVSCGAPSEGLLYRQITQSGSVVYVRKCVRCNASNPFRAYAGVFIPKESVESVLSLEEMEGLPVLMPDASSRCVVCGKRNGEMHHWAPKAICGPDMAERYPKDFLCVDCHQDWHRKVTPSIVK